MRPLTRGLHGRTSHGLRPRPDENQPGYFYPTTLVADIDSAFAEIVLPSGDDWRAALRERADSQRATLRRHPWAVHLLESRTTPRLINLRHHDAVLGFLRGTGFGVRSAAQAYALLDAFVLGFAVQEQELPFDAVAGLRT